MYSLKLLFTVISLIVVSVQPQENTNLTDSCTITEYSQVNSVLSSCTNIVVSNLRVPSNKQLNLSLKDGTTLTFRGVTIFDVGTINDWLVTISGIRITVKGEPGSWIDGQGAHYWDGQGGSGGKIKPKLLHIYNVNNAKFENVNVRNCPMFCTGVNGATDLTIDGWRADNSAGLKLGKNTDGIGISSSKNVRINNIYIENQDQCLYVNSGSNMLFTNIHCVGSHGLCATAGFNPTDYDANTTKNITFRNCVLESNMYGIRLIGMSKHNGPGGPGEVSDITFENVEIKDVTKFGISAEGDYGDPGHTNDKLAMKNIKLNNIHGTVLPHARAVNIICGKKCSNWVFTGVNIKGSKQENQCNFQPTGFKC